MQEMIDIADFALGQSRMLYGNTMHSERPSHRMYEQWHPLGVVGTISAFNFPVAVFSWNAFIAAICGNVNIWKPSPRTPLCAVAVQRIINDALANEDLPPVFFPHQRRLESARPGFRRRPARRPALVYRLLRGRQGCRGTCCRTHGQEPARARRQQCDHRRRVCQPRTRGPGHCLRRRRYRGAALHIDPPCARPSLAVRRSQERTAQSLCTGAHRRPAR